jgi:hypothetical protein
MHSTHSRESALRNGVAGRDGGTEATAFASPKDKCGSSSFNLLPMVCGSFSFIEKYAII